MVTGSGPEHKGYAIVIQYLNESLDFYLFLYIHDIYIYPSHFHQPPLGVVAFNVRDPFNCNNVVPYMYTREHKRDRKLTQDIHLIEDFIKVYQTNKDSTSNIEKKIIKMSATVNLIQDPLS